MLQEGRSYIGDRVIFDIPDAIEPCCKSMVLMVKDHASTKASKCPVCNRLWRRIVTITDKWEEGEAVEQVLHQTPFFGGIPKTQEEYKLDAMEDDLKYLKSEKEKMKSQLKSTEEKLDKVRLNISDELKEKKKEMKGKKQSEIKVIITDFLHELNKKYEKRPLEREANKLQFALNETDGEINYLEYEIQKFERQITEYHSKPEEENSETRVEDSKEEE